MTNGRTRTPTVIIAFALLAAGTALATAPDRIELGFDYSSHVLTLEVQHPTFHVVAHHVAKITVMLNDSLVVLQRLSSQTDDQEQSMQCVISGAKPGDKLTVTAVCSLYGKRTETLLLPDRSP